MKRERDEEVPSIVEQLNDEFRKLSDNPYDYPTVERLAARLHIDMFTIQNWMETDGRFQEGLAIAKKTLDDDPEKDTLEPEIKTAVLSFGIVLVLEETKKRYTV